MVNFQNRVQTIAVRALVATDRLFGPDQGRRDHAAIIARRGADRIVALRMSGLRVVDVSWAREVIARLLEQHARDGAVYLDGGAHPDVTDNIDAALYRRGLSLLMRHADGSWEVLGRTPTPEALQVLRIVQRKGETTARSICSALGALTIQACNNRLRDLLAAGLVARERARPIGGGKEFVYRSLWFSAPTR